jgi:hypothetical protein
MVFSLLYMVLRAALRLARPHRGIDLRAREKHNHVEPVEIAPPVKRRDLLGGLIHECYSLAA